jgi:CelD/BcsL family acetyltransferase involved in cellulose biosynthesis
MQPAPSLTVCVLSRPEQVAALADEWRALLVGVQADSLFLTWEWVSAWLACFADGCRLRVIEVRRRNGGQLQGVAPLALYERRWGRRRAWTELGFIGRGLGPDHMDFLIRQGSEAPVSHALIEAVKAMSDEWDVLHLDGLVPSSAIVTRLDDLLPRRARCNHRVACPFIHLPDDYATWLETLGKRRRYRLRRNRRDLETAYPGQIRVRRVDSPAELPAALATLARLHRAVRMAKGTSNAFRSADHLRFHLVLAEQLLKRDCLRLYLLEIGAEEVAALYGFRHRERFLFYATGYDLAFAAHSPGVYILHHAIREAIAEGAEIFDFLRGDEGYKSLYTGRAQQDLDIRLGCGLRGRWVVRLYCFTRQRAYPIWKSLKRRAS